MDMPFPAAYGSSFADKCVSLRIGNEEGRYQAHETYRAVTYGGKDLGVYLRVTRVNHYPSITEAIDSEGFLLSLKDAFQLWTDMRETDHLTAVDVIHFKVL